MSMKHLVRTLGLALVAVLAVGAMASSAAFGASEFKANKAFPIEFEGKGGKATFETENKATVTCNESKSTGKVLNAEKAEVTITYSSKCELKGAAAGNGPCKNAGGKPEEIKTEKLTGEPGDQIGGGAAGTEPGMLFTSASGTLAKFECTEPAGFKQTATIVVTGSVVCKSKGASVGKLAKTGEIECKKGAKAGEQLYQEIDVKGLVTKGHFLTAEGKVGFIKNTEKDSQETTETLEYLPAGTEVEQTL